MGSSSAKHNPLSRVLQSVGIPEAKCFHTAEQILADTRSPIRAKRLRAIFQVHECCEFSSSAGGTTPVLVDLVAFVLEQGIERGISAGLKEAAEGYWKHVTRKKDLYLVSNENDRIVINKVAVYAELLFFLAVDKPCAVFIERQIPELLQWAKDIFSYRGHATACESVRQAGFYQARGALLHLLARMSLRCKGILNKLAKETAFLKSIIKHADFIQQFVQEPGSLFETDFSTALMLLYNVVLNTRSDLRALREDLFCLVEKVLPSSKFRLR